MTSPASLEAVAAARHPASAPAGYRGRGFVYVLATSGAEDLLKIGMTHDPLERWPAFHPRWFEAFDLEHSLLVETETRRDAQALETRFHHRLAVHHCPVPLTIRARAGGGTEWYRGAYPSARRLVLEQQALGHVVHLQARAWCEAPMRDRQMYLDGLIREAHADHCAGWLAQHQRQALRDLVDAHRCFDPALPARIPADLLAEIGIHA
ncbi:GIY-YIG nuclease family protein [Luteimonas sp. 50]|uniref:GIY-YIG nuclease family protein n=1 Tax=Cognatiluteimonas sedimenti TaxID=2927791 RepID=A0ABT0A6Q8_9GAMM|nr:GIY-YIG nuclease family protein [Lysobacter sedimenti]MCJ0826649.1 GIY-YIG nuclease family protein [Lysobacter sedimenti]